MGMTAPNEIGHEMGSRIKMGQMGHATEPFGLPLRLLGAGAHFMGSRIVSKIRSYQ